MGSGANNNTVNQSVTHDQHQVNLPELAQELSKLRIAMKAAATEPEHDIDVGRVAQAELEAKAGNVPKAMQSLKSLGKWTLELAVKFGAGCVVKMIEEAMHKPPA